MRGANFLPILTLASLCCGATASGLIARYGDPVMQQFTGAPGLILTVEYSPDRRIRVMQIAPEGYRADTLSTGKTMTSESVWKVIEFFAAPGARTRMQSTISCLTSPEGGVCPVTESDGEITIISRRFMKPGNPSVDLSATITSKTPLPQTSMDLELHFGAPLAEEFLAESGIGVLAKYGARRNVTELEVRLVESVLTRENPHEPHYLPGGTVDRIIDELAPVSERGAELGRMMTATGMSGSEMWRFENVTISRVILISHLEEGEWQVQAAYVRWGKTAKN